MHDLTERVTILTHDLVGDLLGDFYFAPLVNRLVEMIRGECQRAIVHEFESHAEILQKFHDRAA